MDENQRMQQQPTWSQGECTDSTERASKVRIEPMSLELWGNCTAVMDSYQVSRSAASVCSFFFIAQRFIYLLVFRPETHRDNAMQHEEGYQGLAYK